MIETMIRIFPMIDDSGHGYSEARFNIGVRSGLDGRRSTLIAMKTQRYPGYEFRMARGDMDEPPFVDGKSILGILTLGAEYEAPLIMRVFGDNPGRESALSEVMEYIRNEVFKYFKGNETE